MQRPNFGTAPRKTWILLANRSEAKILLESQGRIDFVQELDHPAGRQQNREIDIDAKGSRYSSSAGRGNSNAHSAGTPSHQMKHGLDPQEEAAEHVADLFAHRLARVLSEARTHSQFDDLILVAEPGFLGKMRAFIDAETSKHILITVNHNWTNLPVKDLFAKITGLVTENKKVA